MKTLLLVILILFFVPVKACDQPIDYSGTCPLGYYRSGGYCVKNR